MAIYATFLLRRARFSAGKKFSKTLMNGDKTFSGVRWLIKAFLSFGPDVGGGISEFACL
jgi:hypothetical protein